MRYELGYIIWEYILPITCVLILLGHLAEWWVNKHMRYCETEGCHREATHVIGMSRDCGCSEIDGLPDQMDCHVCEIHAEKWANRQGEPYCLVCHNSINFTEAVPI